MRISVKKMIPEQPRWGVMKLREQAGLVFQCDWIRCGIGVGNGCPLAFESKEAAAIVARDLRECTPRERHGMDYFAARLSVGL